MSPQFPILKMKLIFAFIVLLLLGNVQVSHCIGFNRNNLIEKKSKIDNTNNTMLKYKYFSVLYSNAIKNADEEEGLSSVNNSIYKKKSPGKVFVIAFFPGFFVHGLGHYYVGEIGNGTLLLGIGLLSSYLLYGAGISQGLENNPAGAKEGRTYGLVAAILFFGSWVYDFIGAPQKAEKMNKEHGYSIYIYPRIHDEYFSLNLALSIE